MLRTVAACFLGVSVMGYIPYWQAPVYDRRYRGPMGPMYTSGPYGGYGGSDITFMTRRLMPKTVADKFDGTPNKLWELQEFDIHSNEKTGATAPTPGRSTSAQKFFKATRRMNPKIVAPDNLNGSPNKFWERQKFDIHSNDKTGATAPTSGGSTSKSWNAKRRMTPEQDPNLPQFANVPRGSLWNLVVDNVGQKADHPEKL